jgi:predicted nuclease of predicted toxin-antitoxin system
LSNRDDQDIWLFAHLNDYVIVTFDSDFYDISLINGTPPKIIWLRNGNLTTNKIAELLIANTNAVFDFVNNNDYKHLTCLEII